MPKIVIIGAGIAGFSTALDLALRGFDCTVVDKSGVGSGTSTKSAGMLHSGARYAVNSSDVAKLCNKENQILKKIVPFTIEPNNGLFVILKNSESGYISKFETKCKKIGIDVKKLSREECLKLEPKLGPEVVGGFETPDAVINPFFVIAAYKEQLLKLGCKILEFHNLIGGKASNERWEVIVEDMVLKETKTLSCDVVVNASGSWAGETARKFDIHLDLINIQGTIFKVPKKICSRVVSICGPNTVGDVIIPSGDATLLSSTWHELKNNKPIDVTEEDKRDIIGVPSQIFPQITIKSLDGFFTGMRTHEKHESKNGSQFGVKRNFTIIDSGKNLYTILSGKFIFGRLVAQQTADLICKNLGINIECETDNYVLPEPSNYSGATLANQ